MTRQSHQTAHRSWSSLNARVGMNGPLALSLIVLAITCIFVLSSAAALFTSAFGRGIGDADPDAELGRLVAKHEEAMKTWQARFDGRSVFFKPPAPPPPPRKDLPIEKPPEVVVDPTPVIDPVYRGPSIAFAVGESVYFSPMTANERFLKVRVGEEKSGLKVISCNLPWSVKVGYKGGEYDVPLFNKIDENLFVSSPTKPVILTSFLTTVPGATETNAATPDHTVANLAGDQPPVNPRDPRRSARTAAPVERGGLRERPQPPQPQAGEEEGEESPDEEEIDEDPALDDEEDPEAGEDEGPDPPEEEGEEPPKPEVAPAAPVEPPPGSEPEPPADEEPDFAS